MTHDKPTLIHLRPKEATHLKRYNEATLQQLNQQHWFPAVLQKRRPWNSLSRMSTIQCFRSPILWTTLNLDTLQQMELTCVRQLRRGEPQKEHKPRKPRKNVLERKQKSLPSLRTKRKVPAETKPAKGRHPRKTPVKIQKKRY